MSRKILKLLPWIFAFISAALLIAEWFLLYTPLGLSLITRIIPSVPEEHITSPPQSESNDGVILNSDGTKTFIRTASLGIVFSASAEAEVKYLSFVRRIEEIRQLTGYLADISFMLALAASVVNAILARKDRALASFKDFGARDPRRF